MEKESNFINSNGKHLICDDCETNRIILAKFLSKKYEYDFAKNGYEVIKNIEKNGNYNIIWMDLEMPKMNGIECTNYLRKNLKYKGIIIGMTGYVDAESLNDCYNCGMNNVMIKPLNINILYNYADKYN